MRDANADFTKRRKIAAIACVAALVILAMHSRCTASVSTESAAAMTQKSVAVEENDTGQKAADLSPPETSSDTDTDEADASAAASEIADAVGGLKSIERVLFLGLDHSQGGFGRTDGIVIGIFDYTHQRVGVISVPRDLYVDIPMLGEGRINTVYRVGARVLGREKGLALLKSVIRTNLGIPIDYTAEADFEGFVAAVDELGGIKVDVKCPIEDCFWMGGETCVPLSLSEGEQLLDGKTALLFARSRHGRTDLDRGRRQQAVLMGLKHRLIRPITLLHLPSMVSKLGRFVETDLTLDAMLRMGSLLQHAGRKNLHGMVMQPPIVGSKDTDDKKSVLVLDKEEWNKAFSNLYAAAPPGERTKGVCPAPDVGRHWRERKQKAVEKRKAAALVARDN